MNHLFKNIKLKKLAIAMLTVIVLTVTASPFYVSEAFAGTKHNYELSFNGIVNKAGTYVNMLGTEMDFKIYCDGEHVEDTGGYTITIGSKTGKEIKCKVGTARLDSFGSLWLSTDPDAFFETSVKMYLNTPEGEKIEFGWRKRYGPGHKSDITLTRGEDVVPINGGFGGSSTARMIVKYKGKPVDSFEFMPSGKSLGDISSEGSLLICEPKAEGDQNITIKVGSQQAVFRWHVANLKSNQTSDQYVEEHAESGLKIGFDRYIVDPGSTFGADCDIKITVLYEGKPTSDFTYKTGDKKIGSIRENPDDKSQLLLSPNANGNENIFITCKGETEVFVWHTEHVERFEKENNQNDSDKSETDKVTVTSSVQKDKTDDKTDKDIKDEKSESVSNSQNSKDNTKLSDDSEMTEADAVKAEADGDKETEADEDVGEKEDNDNSSDDMTEKSETEDETGEIEAEDDSAEAAEGGNLSDNTPDSPDSYNPAAGSDSSGFLSHAVRAFSSFIEWLKMIIERLIF